MRIQHNIAAMSSYRNYTNNTSALSKNLEKLSSGYKINRAGDDAAGLAISEKMRAQITGLSAAQKNVKDGISLVKTAEGALAEVHDMLNRMDYLATQSANGTYDNETDRDQLQKELNQLRAEINRIADSANFNGIKLFDGSLSGANITSDGLTTDQVDMAKGVDVKQGTVGGGSYGEFTIELGSAFGNGDKLDITFGGTASGVGTAGKVTLTYTDDPTQAGTGGKFSGTTLEKQAQSIAAMLSATAGLGDKFNIVSEGTTIKITALVEGNKADEVATVTEVKVTNANPVKDDDWKRTAAEDNATKGTAQFELLFNQADGKGVDIPNGATISFEVNIGNDQKMTVSLTEGVDFQKGNTINDTVQAIADALMKAKFDANDDTLLAEEKIAVGDLFTVTCNGAGGLEFENKGSFVGVTGIKFKATGIADVTSTKKTNATTEATADKFVIKLKADQGSGEEAQNLTLGDKLTLKGELADGRTFEIEVEAGKNGFDIGDTWANTMKNLKNLLEIKGMNVKLSDGTTVKSTDIFGDKKEIKFTDTSGTFESTRKGSVMTSKITDVELTPAAAADVSESLNNGQQKTAAESVINFSEGVEYGAIIEVDGQKYEIVRNEDDITGRKNIAVVVDDINDTKAIAEAMKAKLEENLNSNAYEVKQSGSKLTIKTTDIGSTAKAVTASASGDKLTQLEFTLDPSKMKAGSTVTINGQTYEFVNKGDKPSNSGATAIEVANFEKVTAQELGEALASVANGVQGASVFADADGKVTVRGLPDSKGNITTPTVKFDGGTGGLTLQIGDTSEPFNRMTVSIYNMHTADMGIDGISIADQDSAGDAIDVIKSAINYVSDVRGSLGATQNRLEHTQNNLSVMAENIQDAESTIRDTDVAEEMMAYVKNNILVQSAQAMLAQANQLPQGVLQLLG